MSKTFVLLSSLPIGTRFRFPLGPAPCLSAVYLRTAPPEDAGPIEAPGDSVWILPEVVPPGESKRATRFYTAGRVMVAVEAGTGQGEATGAVGSGAKAGQDNHSDGLPGLARSAPQGMTGPAGFDDDDI
jgi:hypothetical protein